MENFKNLENLIIKNIFHSPTDAEGDATFDAASFGADVERPDDDLINLAEEEEGTTFGITDAVDDVLGRAFGADGDGDDGDKKDKITIKMEGERRSLVC